jgi:AmmeMemoRadiSam system protein B/AmmeMemoRadiSam system protein A
LGKGAKAEVTAAVQPAGVAGLFYPADPAALAAGVDASLAKATDGGFEAKAVIAPHAGHVYSGDIAGAAYRLLAARKGQIKRVVLLGPTHRMPVRGLALSPADAWATPLGPAAVDIAVRDELARLPGVSVAAEPFAGEHSLEVQLPFVKRALGDVAVMPILVGEPAPGQVSDVLARLWGGPETAIIVSSDLSHYHDYETCRTRDAETVVGIERLNPAVCEGMRACGYFGIAGLIDQAQRRDLRVTALDIRNSGDTYGPKDRVVGYGAFAFEYAHAARIDEPSRQTLLNVAREVVRQGVMHGGRAPTLNIEGGLSRTLQAQRAAFVTLKVGGALRGCRGSILPHRSLLVDVADNAFKSAFGDPRFPAVSAGELDQLSFSVSILSTPRRIGCHSEAELIGALSPDVDGLILREGERQGLFLPSVWSDLPDPAAFVRHLKAKAGLPPDHWSPTLEAYRFTTETF